MHIRRHVSGPALELLERADLSPARIDAELEALLRTSNGAALRVNQPLLQHIALATGINVTQIRRRSRYLLIAIEQFDDKGAHWQYREETPRNCLFSCRGKVPDHFLTCLGGELLEKLICPTPALARSRIIDVSPTNDTWLNVRVTPDWHPF